MEGPKYSTQEELELYKAMNEALPQSMFLIDKNKIIIGIFNAIPNALAGYSAEDIVGTSILKYANDPSSPFYQACSMLNNAFDHVFNTGETLKFHYKILDNYLEDTVTKISGERILSQVRDITDIVLSQQEIEQKKHKELMMALTAGGLTSWSYDLRTGIISSKLNNNVIGEEMTFEQLLSVILPEYRQMVIDMFDEIISCKSDHANVAVRVRNKNGMIQWSDVHAIPLEYDSNGKVTRIVGSQKDMTTEYEYNERLEELIRHKELMLSELDKAKKKAEQSDALKSAFLANMSHEIRTPLNALVGFSQMISEAENEEERNTYLNIINSNSELLLNLINDILDLSKIEAGYIEYTNTRFDMHELMSELELTISNRLKPGVKLINNKQLEHCFVVLDKLRVKQLYINFLTNACKFTTKGTIEMGYAVENGGIRLYVKDTGCGISKENQAKVFERFEKLDNFTQGTGLGMSICKAIVDTYKGQIGVSSEVGKGSLFWVWLPTEVDGIVEESQEQLFDKYIVSNGKNTKDKSSIKILLAEDIDSNYNLIKAMLKDYNLVRVTNGAEAVEKVRNGSFDFVLMDIRMPVMDGLEATRNIRQFDRHIPVIAITANATEKERIEAMKAGCNGFLAKPVSRERLIEVIIWGR